MSKKKMSVEGYDWDKEASALKPDSQNLTYTMPFTDKTTSKGQVKHLGMPVTVNAFQQMIKRYRDAVIENDSLLVKTKAVTFSKASLFRILSQEGCEGIRIHYALPTGDGKVSFVIEGVDANFESINIVRLADTGEVGGNGRQHSEDDPCLEERGNDEDGTSSITPVPKKLLKDENLGEFIEFLNKKLAEECRG